MKALIFNSGMGTRMGALTEKKPKCMVILPNGETIFERQIRILRDAGVREFMITTGAYKDQIMKVANEKFPHLTMHFIYNPEYENTNYIYSMYLAKDYLDDELILLHGDLVFDQQIIYKLMESPKQSLCLYHPSEDLPEKDFKCSFKNGYLNKVSIHLFDEDCYVFQPLYKLSKQAIQLWIDKVSEFISQGLRSVYAEEAFNQISEQVKIIPMSYEGHYISEIDNGMDLERVAKAIVAYDYRQQKLLIKGSFKEKLTQIVSKQSFSKALIITNKKRVDSTIDILNKYNKSYVIFSDYKKNPRFEDIKVGAKIFQEENCDFIISIGGGSAMDTAKSIQLLAASGEDKFLNKDYIASTIKHVAIPTTAGTGSEASHFAVYYLKGIKYSAAHPSIFPDYTILDAGFLDSLPTYYKKAAMLDALCQSIESYWSKKATKESQMYAKHSITLFLKHYKAYLQSNNHDIGQHMLLAGHYSGKAINITTTTGPHAMSYKLSSMLDIAHGEAVCLLLPIVWQYMYRQAENNREGSLLNTFEELATILGCESIQAAIFWIQDLYKSMDFDRISPISGEGIEVLTKTVNSERLRNNPMALEAQVIAKIYGEIVN